MDNEYRELNVSFKVFIPENDVTWLKEWFQEYTWSISVDKNSLEVNNRFIQLYTKEYNVLLDFLEVLYSYIDNNSLNKKSYFYMLNYDSGMLTYLENGKLKVISMFRPKAIDIICNHLYLYDAEILKNNIKLIKNDEFDKENEIKENLIKTINKKLGKQQREEELADEALDLNYQFLNEYGHILD